MNAFLMLVMLLLSLNCSAMGAQWEAAFVDAEAHFLSIKEKLSPERREALKKLFEVRRNCSQVIDRALQLNDITTLGNAFFTTQSVSVVDLPKPPQGYKWSQDRQTEKLNHGGLEISYRKASFRAETGKTVAVDDSFKLWLAKIKLRGEEISFFWCTLKGKLPRADNENMFTNCLLGTKRELEQTSPTSPKRRVSKNEVPVDHQQSDEDQLFKALACLDDFESSQIIFEHNHAFAARDTTREELATLIEILEEVTATVGNDVNSENDDEVESFLNSVIANGYDPEYP